MVDGLGRFLERVFHVRKEGEDMHDGLSLFKLIGVPGHMPFEVIGGVSNEQCGISAIQMIRLDLKKNLK